MNAKEIRLPLEFVQEGDDVALLLTPEDREKLQSAIKTATENGDVPGAQEAADQWRQALALDAQLRSQPNARLWTAVFKRPDWRDKAHIESEARVYKPETEQYVLLPDLEYPLRVERCLMRVEDGDGTVVGGIEVVPDQAVVVLGALLERYFRLSGDLRRFLSTAPSGPEAETT